jgi:hypothetical protein
MGYGTPAWQGWVLNEEQSLPLIYHAYQRGINTWDTVSFLILILRKLRGKTNKKKKIKVNVKTIITN